MRVSPSVLFIALLPIAAAAHSPPYTMAFEEALAAYGGCLRAAVDRYDPSSITPELAARGAAASCSSAYEVVEAQLASDFAARDGLRPESARAAARRELRPVARVVERIVVEHAQGRSRTVHAQDR